MTSCLHSLLGRLPGSLRGGNWVEPGAGFTSPSSFGLSHPWVTPYLSGGRGRLESELALPLKHQLLPENLPPPPSSPAAFWIWPFSLSPSPQLQPSSRHYRAWSPFALAAARGLTFERQRALASLPKGPNASDKPRGCPPAVIKQSALFCPALPALLPGLQSLGFFWEPFGDRNAKMIL